MTVYVDETRNMEFKMNNKNAKLVTTENGFYVICGEDIIIDASTIFKHGDAWLEMFAPDGFKTYIHADDGKASFGVRIE